MAKQITLALKDNAGNVIGQYNINNDNSAVHIPAVNGVYYQFTDLATGIGPVRIINFRVD